MFKYTSQLPEVSILNTIWCHTFKVVIKLSLQLLYWNTVSFTCINNALWLPEGLAFTDKNIPVFWLVPPWKSINLAQVSWAVNLTHKLNVIPLQFHIVYGFIVDGNSK